LLIRVYVYFSYTIAVLCSNTPGQSNQYYRILCKLTTSYMYQKCRIK